MEHDPADTDQPAAAAPTRLRFTAAEFAGGLGDLGTFLPLSLALAVGCGLDLGLVFICAGLMNIATGVLFGQPIPVQPMKAIAAIAVAAGFGADAVMAAGIGMGAMLVVFAALPRIERLIARIPASWVAAIQLGVGLKLALLGLRWVTGMDLPAWQLDAAAALPWRGMDSVEVAVAVLIVLLGFARRSPFVLPAVVALGMIVAALGWTADESASAGGHAGIAPWALSGEAWSTGFFQLALPQLPLTLLNSVVAVCALSAAYYGGRGIGARPMALSVGVMNLVAAPLGGMPMCHGAGGLAAQHHFGARTGGAVVMLGAAKVAVALLLWPWLPALVAAFPVSVLAVLVLLGGLRLAGAARPVLTGVNAETLVVLGGASVMVFVGTLEGFAAAILLWVAMWWASPLGPTQRPPQTTDEAKAASTP